MRVLESFWAEAYRLCNSSFTLPLCFLPSTTFTAPLEKSFKRASKGKIFAKAEVKEAVSFSPWCHYHKSKVVSVLVTNLRALSRELLRIVHGSWHLPPSAWGMSVVNQAYLTGTCAWFAAAGSEVHRAENLTSPWIGSRGQIFPEGLAGKRFLAGSSLWMVVCVVIAPWF